MTLSRTSPDRPIDTADEDRLERTPIAEAIARDFAEGPIEGGIVAALNGPWGSGKTSLLNLVAGVLAEMDDIEVIRFNPWFFTGTEQLVQSFFTEIAAQLQTSADRRLSNVASSLEGYAKVLEPLSHVPAVGHLAGGMRGVLSGARVVLSRRDRFSATDLRKAKLALETALRESGKRFVVMVDDVDRLERHEIRELVRLVRLVGDFPRTNYLLAFDRARVEQALGEGDAALGRDYLEKIVQIVYNLPAPASDAMSTLILEALDRSIEGLDTGPFDPHDWGNIYQFIVKPLVRSPRDARRYVNAVPSALNAVGPEVAVADVLGLEAVRTLMPDTFAFVADHPVELTTVGSGIHGLGSDDRRRAELSSLLHAMLQQAGPKAEIGRSVLRWLFPAANGALENVHYGPDSQRAWRRDRRVADITALSIYLQRNRPRGAGSATLVDAVFHALTDEARLRTLLGSLNPVELEEVLDRLEDYERDFPTDPGNAIVVLLEQLPRLRTGRSGMWDFGADLKLDRIILRLLRRVENEDRRDTLVRDVLARVRSLSMRFQLLHLVGYEPNAGHELISRELWEREISDLQSAVLETPSGDLREERALPRLLYLVHRDQTRRQDPRYEHIVGDAEIVKRLLISTLGEGFSQTMGEAAVRREFQLPWEFLEALVTAERLHAVVRELEATLTSRAPQIEQDAVATAARYRAGWRPEGWDRRSRTVNDAED